MKTPTVDTMSPTEENRFWSVFESAISAGASIAEIAREFKTTRQTIMRARDASLKLVQQG